MSADKQNLTPGSCPHPSGVFIKTNGCQMNEYDTEKMYRLLSDDYSAVEDVDHARVVIVNTCSVREKGEHKLYSYLGRIRELKESRPDIILGVAGCVAQQEGSAILAREKAVDFVVGTHNLSLVPSLVRQAREGQKSVAVDFREEWEDLPIDFSGASPNEADGIAVGPVRGFVSSARALVSIQRGCNKRCSFCVVPNTRGPEVSRSPEEIMREIRFKLRLGAKEVLLLGQTVNSYGRDLSPRMSFASLIRQIATIDGLKRIRFISPHPAEVRDDFIELYSEVPQLMPHIHLPLQSGNDRILRAMNRNYKISRYLEIVAELRERVPNIAVTTDIIVGFPSETDADFQDTLEVVQRVQYDSAYYYKYSRRPHTASSTEEWCNQEIDQESVSRRFAALDLLQGGITTSKNDAQIGKRFEVMIEGAATSNDNAVRGRTPQNTLVELNAGSLLPGDLVLVDIIGATPRSLKGECISRPTSAASENATTEAVVRDSIA